MKTSLKGTVSLKTEKVSGKRGGEMLGCYFRGVDLGGLTEVTLKQRPERCTGRRKWVCPHFPKCLSSVSASRIIPLSLPPVLGSKIMNTSVAQLLCISTISWILTTGKVPVQGSRD